MMVLAIGIDSVEIERLERWHAYSQKKLMQFFSESEIAYCLSVPEKSAERFAARFAAKEALLKALCQLYPRKRFYLRKVAKACEVQKKVASPSLFIDWQALNLSELSVLVSLTHTKKTASAVIILQNS